MRIVLVHNRRRSAAPSGENRVADQEREALTALGHEVIPFERSSDEIGRWSLAKKASLPAKVIWNRESYRDLAATAARAPARCSTYPQHVPSAQRLCPSCLPRRPGSGRGHISQLQAGVCRR